MGFKKLNINKILNVGPGMESWLTTLYRWSYFSYRVIWSSLNDDKGIFNVMAHALDFYYYNEVINLRLELISWRLTKDREKKQLQWMLEALLLSWVQFFWWKTVPIDFFFIAFISILKAINSFVNLYRKYISSMKTTEKPFFYVNDAKLIKFIL
jgi:hypothetical protein